jgi:hypothetical protein
MTASIVAAFLIPFVLCAAVVVILCRRCPIVEEFEDEHDERANRVMQIIASAKHHREQLEARAAEMVEIHNREPGSCDADDLRSVVWDGEDYALTMTRIFRRARAMR